MMYTNCSSRLFFIRCAERHEEHHMRGRTEIKGTGTDHDSTGDAGGSEISTEIKFEISGGCDDATSYQKPARTAKGIAAKGLRLAWRMGLDLLSAGARRDRDDEN
jgi:hypothetical protein